jgi:environmental stress-induced protein Ves
VDGDEDVRLKHNFAAKVETYPPFTPHKFKGEWHTECLVTNHQKVVDMNVIFERQQVKANVTALETIEGLPIHHTITSKGTTLVYSYNGAVDITSNDLSDTPGGDRYTAKAGETFEVCTIEDRNIQLQFEAHPGYVAPSLGR